MAGRDISVTHEALGAVRVMKTTGAMGEIVGMAASLCRSAGCSPRAIHAEHLDALKALMSRGVGRINRYELDDEGRGTLPGAAASLRGKALRYESDRDSIGYWRHEGDYAEWELEIPGGRMLELCLELSCGRRRRRNRARRGGGHPAR